MKAVILAFSVFVASAGVADAQSRPTLVPPGWTEVFRDPATLTRRFESPDGVVSLTASQSLAGRNARTRTMDEIAYRAGESITYQRRGSTFIAVSGYRGDDIFYRKSNLACGGARWNNIEFIYPRAEKKRLDAMVTAVARGMTQYSGDCG